MIRLPVTERGHGGVGRDGIAEASLTDASDNGRAVTQAYSFVGRPQPRPMQHPEDDYRAWLGGLDAVDD